jgi:hypothetical protein
MFSDHNRPSTHLKNLIFIGHHRRPPVSGLLGVPCCVTVPWKLPFGPGRQSECDADLDEGVDFVSAGHFLRRHGWAYCFRVIWKAFLIFPLPST